ncbi:MAG: prephenate dehydrogenase [Elusimicrobia bacterium]|nr:prephenate dehydrogenase [Elusimicrobiota bacterium]
MKIAIIGVGLIGGSIGLAIKSEVGSRDRRKSPLEKSKVKIIGIGRNLKRLKLAKKIGAVDEITTDIKRGVKDADIVFVCLPVGLIAETVKNILPYCKKDTIITDVGSVKQPIVSEVEKFFTQSLNLSISQSPAFIGGHPIAGSEKTSVKYASKELFENAVVVLTPTNKTDKKSLDIVKKLWKKMQAKVKIMSPVRHDKILAMTSHLPHAIAFALVNLADNFEFVGNGFKDTTRIASSDPEMWADIIFNNRTNVRQAIKRIKFELEKIEKAKTKEELAKIFRKAKEKRDYYVHKR